MALDAIVAFVQQNPILVLMVLFIFYRMYQSRQPWPDYGGNITAVKSLEEWRSLLNGSGLTLVSGPQHLACAVERVRSRDRGAPRPDRWTAMRRGALPARRPRRSLRG